VDIHLTRRLEELLFEYISPYQVRTTKVRPDGVNCFEVTLRFIKDEEVVNAISALEAIRGTTRGNVQSKNQIATASL
jgi:hypothetical protein